MAKTLISKQLARALFLVISSAFLLASCGEENPVKTDDSDFLRLKESGFTLRGEPFFPKMLNYVVDYRFVEDTFTLGVHRDYEGAAAYTYHSVDSILLQRREHLTLIKDMGFNTIRLCLDRIWKKEEGLGYPTGGRILYLDRDTELILSLLDDYVTDASEKGIRIMLLIPPPVQNETIAGFTKALLKRFSDNPTIFAYDFNNEPLYDREHSAIPKAEVYEIVEEWKEWMEELAPDQFLTIGYSEPIEVFSWDPSILPVDFLSFHTYNPLRVPNEIYWYANYANKPWMIGETALLADGKKYPYEWQVEYMKASFDYAVASGGIGYGWWGFQEVPKTNYQEESTGLITPNGTIYTSDSLLAITGTLKPAAMTMKELDPAKVNTPPERPSNYFNILGYENYKLNGRVIDEEGNPVEGACIRGWTEYYIIGQNTFSDENGNFTLYSNDVIKHLMISAPGMTKWQKNEKVSYHAKNEESVEEDSLPNKDLEYQMIDYADYLKYDRDSLPLFFEFADGKFDSFQYQSELEDVVLEKWD
jgi:hypothetical protein